jgi:single-stranded-DNA-specific exonuclease
LSRHYLDSEYISFFIGPMINSKGRLDHPRAALELLTCSDEKRVNQLFDQLLDSNMERKQVQKKLLKEAQLEWLTQEESQWPKAIILAQEQWHEGVIGIAASQLVQTYQRPTIVLAPSTQDPQMWKGSGRTWGNLHLLELLQDYRHFFEKFGGHRAAAGLSIRREQLEPFKQALLQDPRLELIEHRTLPPLELPLSSIGPEFINQLWSLAPFGQGHPLPHLKLKDCRLEKFQKLTGGHVKWTFSALSPSLQQISGISFYRDLAPQRFLTDPQYFMDRQQHQQLRIVGKLQLNIFAQREQWQLLVEELYFEEELSLAREQQREATGP